jgi:hypothetical protein
MRLIVTLSLMPFMSGIDSSACAVPQVATASEITDGADTILLVKVPNEKIERVSPITMDVLEVLKGDFKRKTVAVEGETPATTARTTIRPHMISCDQEAASGTALPRITRPEVSFCCFFATVQFIGHRLPRQTRKFQGRKIRGLCG